jgi:hypothetical protein
MNIALPLDLTDIEVADLDAGDRREAFRQHFDLAEALRLEAQGNVDACGAIAEDLDLGELAGICVVCRMPLFEKDQPMRTALGRVTCRAPSDPAICKREVRNG